MIRRGRPKQCFRNAGRTIRREWLKNPNLRYCEGFMNVGEDWTHHAWIEDIQTGRVYEVTYPAFLSHRVEGYHAVIKLNKLDYLAAGEGIVEGPMLPCQLIGCDHTDSAAS
jgi:hypothetical protein